MLTCYREVDDLFLTNCCCLLLYNSGSYSMLVSGPLCTFKNYWGPSRCTLKRMWVKNRTNNWLNLVNPQKRSWRLTDVCGQHVENSFLILVHCCWDTAPTRRLRGTHCVKCRAIRHIGPRLHFFYPKEGTCESSFWSRARIDPLITHSRGIHILSAL